MYTAYSPTRTLAGVGVGFTDWTLPEPPVDYYTTELMDNAKAFSDTALIVLARSGGEGQDLPAEMGPVIDGTIDNMRQTEANGNAGYNYYAAAFTNNSESYDDFAPEESYLQLSQSERDMVDLVAANVNFAKTDVLAPGASQTIPFTIPKEDMASYDSSAIKTANGGYIRPLQSRRPRRGRGCDARHRGQKRPEAGGHDGQAL